MKINLFNDEKFSGCYDADLEQWDLYITYANIDKIPCKVELSQDGETFWKYFGIKEASRNTGFSCWSISRCCHDKTHQKKVQGFGWIFSGEENGTVIDKK